jgi:hypothetical protein
MNANVIEGENPGSRQPSPNIELVLFTKADGPLTKKIRLNGSGILSDGSDCRMTHGTAHRIFIACIQQFADLIRTMGVTQAPALGALRADLPDKVSVVTKRKLRELSGSAPPPRDIIARTQDFVVYGDGPGPVLIDFDTKGMPDHVRKRLDQAGGGAKAIMSALRSILPALGATARVLRLSTSAGLFRTDTNTLVPGSDGAHIYLFVSDRRDAVRFLQVLHERCWLAGYGWMMVGKAGQYLERSIIDRMVGDPARLVFEAPPILEPPLAQDAERRKPAGIDGQLLDTHEVCPPLTLKETDELNRLRAREKHRLAGDAAKARELFIAEHAEKIAQRKNVSKAEAERIVRKWSGGVLLPDVELAFTDPELAGKTVADVLANPAEFEGEALADPLEGVEYGRSTAIIMRRAGGTPWIRSFAHGLTTYELRYDAAAIRAVLGKVGREDIIPRLVELLLRADIDPAEEETLIALAKQLTGITIPVLRNSMKKKRQEQAAKERAERLEQILATSTDPRPMVAVPLPDAPWLPEMGTINQVVSKDSAPIPASRDVEDEAALARQININRLHAFSNANEPPPKPKKGEPNVDRT